MVSRCSKNCQSVKKSRGTFPEFTESSLEVRKSSGRCSAGFSGSSVHSVMLRSKILGLLLWSEGGKCTELRNCERVVGWCGGVSAAAIGDDVAAERDG